MIDEKFMSTILSLINTVQLNVQEMGEMKQQILALQQENNELKQKLKSTSERMVELEKVQEQSNLQIIELTHAQQKNKEEIDTLSTIQELKNADITMLSEQNKILTERLDHIHQPLIFSNTTEEFHTLLDINSIQNYGLQDKRSLYCEQLVLAYDNLIRKTQINIARNVIEPKLSKTLEPLLKRIALLSLAFETMIDIKIENIQNKQTIMKNKIEDVTIASAGQIVTTYYQTFNKSDIDSSNLLNDAIASLPTRREDFSNLSSSKLMEQLQEFSPAAIKEIIIHLQKLTAMVDQYHALREREPAISSLTTMLTEDIAFNNTFTDQTEIKKAEMDCNIATIIDNGISNLMNCAELLSKPETDIHTRFKAVLKSVFIRELALLLNKSGTVNNIKIEATSAILSVLGLNILSTAVNVLDAGTIINQINITEQWLIDYGIDKIQEIFNKLPDILANIWHEQIALLADSTISQNKANKTLDFFGKIQNKVVNNNTLQRDNCDQLACSMGRLIAVFFRIHTPEEIANRLKVNVSDMKDDAVMNHIIAYLYTAHRHPIANTILNSVALQKTVTVRNKDILKLADIITQPTLCKERPKQSLNQSSDKPSMIMPSGQKKEDDNIYGKLNVSAEAFEAVQSSKVITINNIQSRK